MNELKALESTGFVLPSGWYLFGAILFGIAGFIAYHPREQRGFALLLNLSI